MRRVWIVYQAVVPCTAVIWDQAVQVPHWSCNRPQGSSGGASYRLLTSTYQLPAGRKACASALIAVYSTSGVVFTPMPDIRASRCRGRSAIPRRRWPLSGTPPVNGLPAGLIRASKRVWFHAARSSACPRWMHRLASPSAFIMWRPAMHRPPGGLRASRDGIDIDAVSDAGNCRSFTTAAGSPSTNRP